MLWANQKYETRLNSKLNDIHGFYENKRGVENKSSQDTTQPISRQSHNSQAHATYRQ